MQYWCSELLYICIEKFVSWRWNKKNNVMNYTCSQASNIKLSWAPIQSQLKVKFNARDATTAYPFKKHTKTCLYQD